MSLRCSLLSDSYRDLFVFFPKKNSFFFVYFHVNDGIFHQIKNVVNVDIKEQGSQHLVFLYAQELLKELLTFILLQRVKDDSRTTN